MKRTIGQEIVEDEVQNFVLEPYFLYDESYQGARPDRPTAKRTPAEPRSIVLTQSESIHK